MPSATIEHSQRLAASLVRTWLLWIQLRQLLLSSIWAAPLRVGAVARFRVSSSRYPALDVKTLRA